MERFFALQARSREEGGGGGGRRKEEKGRGKGAPCVS